ncbi:hypothetical protein O2313_11690 [Bacillus amyloliquefaciens]|uniref:hypothetical protein n=1 Tax=Bacillus amyloliquefaciens TaxID=1390 RepID=UPI0022AED7B0|nr:hypothetical protein [Bacillus amyloliquefaciens]MCZ4248184.1 hypothetical protein [Bacillus amyloliquefaciens]
MNLTGNGKQQRQIEAKTGESHEFKHMRDDIVISKPDKLGEVTGWLWKGYGLAIPFCK